MFDKAVNRFLTAVLSVILIAAEPAAAFAYGSRDGREASDLPVGADVTAEEINVSESMISDNGFVSVSSSGNEILPELNIEDHIVYMNGDSGNLFRPDDEIKRSETAKLIWTLISNKDALHVDGRSSFSDVPEDAWYSESVNKLAETGILSGYGGNFRPDASISRAEFVSLLSRFSEKQETAAVDMNFSDVDDSFWAADAIRVAYANGWISGYADGSFRPSSGITRTETAVIVNRALGRSGDETAIRESVNDGIRFFPDVDYDYWGYTDIVEATNHHEYVSSNKTEKWTSFTKEKSVLTPGMHQIGGRLYYVDPQTGDFVCNQYIDGHYFGDKRYYVTGNGELDDMLYSVTSVYLSDGMTQEAQLRTLFYYVVDNYTYRKGSILEAGQTGWEEEFALEMFKNGKGNCYRHAAVFYYLAKDAGYEPVAVAGYIDGSMRSHGWVEITDINGNVCIYDTVMTRSRKKEIFKVPYAYAPYIYTKVQDCFTGRK